MARLPNGLRKADGGHRHPLYAASRSKPVLAVPTPEQIAQRQQDSERFIERMLLEMSANRGLGKLKDTEARVAVEGDTDMNHDNVEAAE